MTAARRRGPRLRWRIVYSSGTRRGSRAEKYLLLRSEKEKLYAVAGNYTVRALVWAQEALSGAEKEIRFNAAFPQCLEVCLSGILEKNF